jgi:hypothetical protein
MSYKEFREKNKKEFDEFHKVGRKNIKLEKLNDKQKMYSKPGKIFGGSLAAISAIDLVTAKREYNKYKKLASETKNKKEKAKYEALVKKYEKRIRALKISSVAGAGVAIGSHAVDKGINGATRKSRKQYSDLQRKLTYRTDAGNVVPLEESYLKGYYDALEEIEYLEY